MKEQISKRWLNDTRSACPKGKFGARVIALIDHVYRQRGALEEFEELKARHKELAGELEEERVKARLLQSRLDRANNQLEKIQNGGT
jgi:hypothetical protein